MVVTSLRSHPLKVQLKLAIIKRNITVVKSPVSTATPKCPTECFYAGTKVLTEDGYKDIEDIKVGDKVLAYDENTGKRELKEVKHLFRNQSKDWIGATVNGLEIVSTPGHKYFLPDKKEWKSAAELKKGTKVLLSDGSYGTITKVRKIRYAEPQTTYNFEVEDFHTYYVGSGVLVHNLNCNTKTKTIETKAPTQMKSEYAVDAWNEYLGPNQTDINPLTHKNDPNRIFATDNNRSIRFSSHEMNSIGTTKAHFHFETWIYNEEEDLIIIYNILQRLK